MKLLQMTLRAALRALRRNKMRSALTMLGIVIGVAAVIATVSIGQGADAAVQEQIRSLGTNLLMVVPGATTASGVRSGWGGIVGRPARDGVSSPDAAGRGRRRVRSVRTAAHGSRTPPNGHRPPRFRVRSASRSAPRSTCRFRPKT